MRKRMIVCFAVLFVFSAATFPLHGAEGETGFRENLTIEAGVSFSGGEAGFQISDYFGFLISELVQGQYKSVMKGNYTFKISASQVLGDRNLCLSEL